MNKLIFFCSFFIFFTGAVYAQENVNLQLAEEYYDNGEFEKAVELYDKLAKKKIYIYAIHKKYADAMLKLEQYAKAEKYLKKQVKAYPLDGMFNVEYGVLLRRMKRETEANKHFDNFIDKIKKDDMKLRYAARFFISAGLYKEAEKLYKEGQKHSTRDFSYDLGNLYAASGQTSKMINQYLGILGKNESQLNYVQNMLQARIRDDEDWEKLEPLLYEKIQANPAKTVYNEMLVWYFLQRKLFYQAFMQAKAVDRRKKLRGTKIFEIGRLALNNKDYKNAVKIFEHLSEKYKQEPIYARAKNYLMKSKEELIKNTYPVDMVKIRSLVQDYQQNIDELGLSSQTVESAKNMALLYAFYLDDKDKAIEILNKVIKLPRVRKNVISSAKTDLADIYLLKDEWWEATLLYSQVEKAEKETHTAHLAKLKNAKLSYYRGDFTLAKEHLDILKLATSREIANDAMDLSLLIQDNTGLDTSMVAMERYAAIDLLVFQQRHQQALHDYDQMLKDFKGHTLEDEILLQKATINLKLGNFNSAIESLNLILKDYKDDIYADDANFMIAEIYEKNLNDKEKAMEYYTKQLKDYSGSIFNVEARKRFRELRGDFVGEQ